MTQTNLPQHVAIVMDGNGRWAKARRLPRLAGHKSGAETLKKIVQAVYEKIPYLTVYAFSSENWKRPVLEVKGLMNLLDSYLEREEKTFLEKSIRLQVIGRLDRIPTFLKRRIESLIKRTKKHTTMTLQIALDYGGRSEIVEAARSLAVAVQEGRVSPDTIDEVCFEDHLFTKGIPDPDLLIRTSGEQRLSNYLLWQIAYTELVFVDKYWPDFTSQDFFDAIGVYQKRERRFGCVA
jgi:undecaprenyl diphosphate synthase